ncbi:tetratricopeptide repeat protein [Massilia sp. METH4]|uniref:tetratricopeptide repeat protein n=1 Tax=Massilia sp. METH4 TaxID=3123041 RepID=UPI0030D4DDEC
MKNTSDLAASSGDGAPSSSPSLAPSLALEQAAAALARGDHVTALSLLRPLADLQAPSAALSPAQSSDLWRLLAEAVQAQGGDPLPELVRWVESDPGNSTAHLQLGHALQDHGELAAASNSYRHALSADPANLEALVELGSVEQGMGNHGVAVECYQLALKLAPKLHQLYPSLASGLHALGRYEEASAAWSKALRLLGDDALYHYGRAESLRAWGRLGEALNASERAVKLVPDDPAALQQLASLQMALGKTRDSALNFGKALLGDPHNVQAHIDFAAVLHQLGLDDEALAHLRDALRIDPQSWLAAGNLGGLLVELGRHAEAVPLLRQALEIKPDYAFALNNLGTALHTLGQRDTAVDYFRAAIGADPGFIDAYRNLSVVLSQLGRHRESFENSVVAMALAPDDAELLLNLANAQAAMGQLDRSIAHLRKAARLDPKAANIRSNLAHYLSVAGDTAAAIEMSRQAIALDPAFTGAHSNLLFYLAHGDADIAASRAAHETYAKQFERQDRWIGRHETDNDPDRRIRLAFISGDLYHHAVANFIRPVLEQLRHDPSLELVIYYTNTVNDSVNAALRASVPLWRDVSDLADDALEALIRADRIDVLVDLSGHTGFNRLHVLARKPAPVQVTWIGYPGTTGLRAVDYFLTDPHLLPPGRFDDHYSERIAYLPASAVFQPADEQVDVNPLPALHNGHLTFGSFNRANKIHAGVVQLWAKVLAAVPDSRLLLGALTSDGQKAAMREQFQAAGIGGERLVFHERGSMRDYLALHHQVDLCLDTFPYTGGTTTLHGLWMGVPIVTLAGATTSGRTSAAILSHLGLNDFIAETPEQFVRAAAGWAGRTEELAALRAALRERLEQSALARPDRLAANLSAMVRLMWHRWCSGMPADTLYLEPAGQPPAALEE